ncbi:MAG: E2/UBC family protein [Planctomycetota bacterium]
MLPQNDVIRLAERGIKYTVLAEASMTCVVVQEYRLPPGYDREQADLLLRLSPGFPDVQPDMWWFNPGIRLKDGRVVRATEVTEQHVGRTWQRWSRHLDAGKWQSGIDSLESYLALISGELERCVHNPN